MELNEIDKMILLRESGLATREEKIIIEQKIEQLNGPYRRPPDTDSYTKLYFHDFVIPDETNVDAAKDEQVISISGLKELGMEEAKVIYTKMKEAGEFPE